MSKRLVVLALVSFTTPVHADAGADAAVKKLGALVQEAWYRDSKTNAWKLPDGVTDGLKPSQCTKHLDQMRAMNIPDTAAFELAEDSRDLKKGRHTVAEGRVACAQIEKMGKVKYFEKWAFLAATEAASRSSKELKICVDAYNEIVAAGISPTERVPETEVYVRENMVPWSGTIEEIRIKYCDAGIQSNKDDRAKLEAPFRAVLKNDKLAMVLPRLEPIFTGIYLVGGKNSEDPKELANASIWFDGAGMTGESYCAKGTKKNITLRRYVFDKNHKRISKTEKTFCGEPPNSAFR